MKRKSKILTGASVAIISFAQFPFTAFAADTPTTYQIWIGSTQVTSENKDDILSDGGSVKYDPTIHLLTFDNPKKIEGSTKSSSWWSDILAMESVTMTGTLNMTKNSNLSKELAIWCHGTDLILDNFNLSITGYGGGIISYGNNIKIQNGCDIKITDIFAEPYAYSIGTAGNIVIENSRVTVDNCYSGIAVNSNNLTIAGNNTYVKVSNIKDGEPIVTKNLTLGDDVQLIKDEANGIYTVKSKNYAWTRTYPTNIKFEYNEKYHQGRFTWDRVKNADRYCIAIFYAGKWRIQTQNITTNSYITPKNLKPGATYKVAIAARVNGKWDITNAIRNAVIVNIPVNSQDTDGDGILNSKDSQPNHKNNYPSVLVDYINNDIVDMDFTEETDDDFVICKTPLSEILSSNGVNNLVDDAGTTYPVNGYYDDWYIMALNRNGKATYGLYKMREQEYDSDDNNDPGVTISFVEFDISKLNDVIYHNTSDTSDLYNEIDNVVRVSDASYSSQLQSYFLDVDSDAPYLIAEAYVDKIANTYSISSIPFPTHLNDIYDEIDNIDGLINSMMNSLIPDAQTIATLYAQRADLSRVPDALTDCNNNFGSTIADENNRVISITSSNNLDYNEKRAILSAYTADTSFNMFAAEVQAHADYLDSGLSVFDRWYSSALRADMAIGEEYESGMFDSYYDPNDSRVVAQANAHGAY
ncbi:hypothetical protein [Ruminococcus albus]|uniref:Fibronectin type-III domain-containing protein n=1 Tax=Ruminococcus albus TaxID=1264 RepID=A0A1H7KTZ1_RUMAL|nr:hypothetical protein SAMN05216469_10778 [Ruminococcus albus]